MADGPVVEFEDVSIAYVRGNPIISNFSMRIREGERVFLIGPNGGGKSTIIKAIVKLIKPEKGVIRVFGQDILKFNDWWKIGYLPQNAAALFEKTTVSVAEFLKAVSTKGHAMTPEDSLILVGFSDGEILRKRVADLSGGMLQRVILASVLINRPKLLLLDEPTVYVDQTGLNALVQILSELHQRWALTTIIATHDIDAVSTFASRVICINRQSYYDGRLEDLLASEQLCRVYGFHVYTIKHGHEWTSR
ncbi:MAG: metal ABC transporter ATP-binding protein [Candidatus Caldarchaeum sp.]|nr:metal ABC transporter ATP-binding protein [Candidatus Caldarchaeum sp.]MCS7137346.1 metal ABC transporter ATP-binding protein [Candidatus Caldarchaeum sp.]MDW7977726.1 metal ABC transporter ATP-binding protein [Candidatus Caldarchaeum sp.]MDW8360496.1 metal ABC transporter ATP-binding protein [Candidatus Caldarchaeum sp.]